MSRPVTVRPGADAEVIDVVRLFEGALLEVDVSAVRAALAGDRDAVYVAERRGRIVGAVFADIDRSPPHVEAIAVHSQHRGEGIGQALLEAAIEAFDAVTASFDDRVRGFYESMGFSIDQRGDRLWGSYPPNERSG
ncbi:MAG: GNAT family N-acetyltransferase [Halobacteriota archaeon]